MRCKRRGLSSGALGLGAGLLLGLLPGLTLLLLLPSSPQSTGQQQQQQARASSTGGGIVAAEQEGPPAPAAPEEEVKKSEQQQEVEVEGEGGSSGLLFVGVMTARKYLDSRARAVYESWGREVPGRIAFFSSEGSEPPAGCPALPLVPLARVDDSYPPQKKSFLMLAHMWARYGERYEWFLRADDDVYVRLDRLERLLRSVDSRRPLYIGQAGRGNSEEFGLLSLEYDENFCMGGPGVIISRETLRRIVPHIKHCLGNLYTGHEDVELGRCVRKFAGISCTWNYEMQSILYHNSSGEQAFTGRLKSKEVHRAISMHPVKRPPYMYRLHNYMRSLEIQELQQRRIELQRDAERMVRLAEPRGSRSLSEPRRSPNRVHWDLISRSEYRLADSNPRRRIYADLREGLEDLTREVMASINACSRQRGRYVEERQALYAYRARTARGADTVLDLLLIYKKYRGRKLTLPVRRHLYLHQHFTGLEMRELSSDNDLDSKVIHFLVPVSGRQKALERFLSNYERVCLETKQRTELHVILFPSLVEAGKEDAEDDGVESTLRMLERLKRFAHAKGKVHVVQGRGKFSRARALDQGADLLREDDLMFFVDVDIGFEAAALQRIRRNSLEAERVYFPVVFSQYDPRVIAASAKPEDKIDELNGFWRLFGFGIVSLYKRDYESIGRFDLTIEGWGKEDVDFYEKAVKSSLQIFRAPDLDLVHVYHGISCDRSLQQHQLSMCKGTRADTYASTQQLASLIYQNPEYLSFAKSRTLTNLSSPAA